MMDWNERISDFFTEYVRIPKDGYTPSGNLTFTTIKSAVAFLLKEGVFDSAQEMREQAMKDYEIILPETIFE